MENNTKGASAPKPIASNISAAEARAAIGAAYDRCSLLHGSFGQLGALFVAIGQLTDSQNDSVRELCDLGRYLCSDWGNSHDCERERLEVYIDALSGVAGQCEGESA